MKRNSAVNFFIEAPSLPLLAQFINDFPDQLAHANRSSPLSHSLPYIAEELCQQTEFSLEPMLDKLLDQLQSYVQRIAELGWNAYSIKDFGPDSMPLDSRLRDVVAVLQQFKEKLNSIQIQRLQNIFLPHLTYYHNENIDVYNAFNAVSNFLPSAWYRETVFPLLKKYLASRDMEVRSQGINILESGYKHLLPDFEEELFAKFSAHLNSQNYEETDTALYSLARMVEYSSYEMQIKIVTLLGNLSPNIWFKHSLNVFSCLKNLPVSLQRYVAETLLSYTNHQNHTLSVRAFNALDFWFRDGKPDPIFGGIICNAIIQKIKQEGFKFIDDNLLLFATNLAGPYKPFRARLFEAVVPSILNSKSMSDSASNILRAFSADGVQDLNPALWEALCLKFVPNLNPDKDCIKEYLSFSKTGMHFYRHFQPQMASILAKGMNFHNNFGVEALVGSYAVNARQNKAKLEKLFDFIHVALNEKDTEYTEFTKCSAAKCLATMVNTGIESLQQEALESLAEMARSPYFRLDFFNILSPEATYNKMIQNIKPANYKAYIDLVMTVFNKPSNWVKHLMIDVLNNFFKAHPDKDALEYAINSLKQQRDSIHAICAVNKFARNLEEYAPSTPSLSR